MGILKKSKAVKKADPLDLLLKNFAGEEVDIVINQEMETPMNITEGGEEHMALIKMPLTVTGFLTDIDDQFIYLGGSVNQINQAVNKDFVVHIGVVDESMLEITDDGKIPAGSFN